MKGSESLPVVQTLEGRCRRCYQCVRHCPAKAIRIVEGQAEVLAERCIGCGNCVRECSQHAKVAISAADEVRQLLGSGRPTAAILAPSFPAQFPNLEYRVVVAMVRALGFGLVSEVGFGADLVAREYRRLLDRDDGRRYVATSCPGIICYVEKYHPELVRSLAPIVSPMVAAARVLKALHGQALQIVFVGPCLAKRREATSRSLAGEVAQA
ncbi:MAG: [Fe-Fe] hydrogenase large subunit C-terminal domain-containing protein, partial [Gemmatimonadota bacterium]